MSQITLAGKPEITVKLRFSPRARRMSLRVSQLDGRVTLTVPKFCSHSEAERFVRSKEIWLRRHVDDMPSEMQIALGAYVPVEGVPHLITLGQGRVPVLSGTDLEVPGPEDKIAAKLQAWFKLRAREALVAASDHYCARLGRPYSRITLRDTRSRWGSCSSQGALMYSWRLIFAPPEVLEYVAAHEVAHLAQMNHSQAFWDQVYDIYGDWREPREWLQREGASLHRYRFDA